MGRIDWRVKDLGLGGSGIGAQTAQIDVDLDEDKIVRIKPLYYGKSYEDDEWHGWEMEARGSVFKSPTRTCVPPLALTYSDRARSKNRVPYPLKRVDWDPNAERHPENRGKSKFVRISWDEATDIIVSEVKRITEAYGPYAILAQGDGHGEVKVIHTTHSNNMRLLHMVNGAYTHQARNPDSWEGWYWGGRHLYGADPLGQLPFSNCLLDVAENSTTLCHWGCDMETTPWGWGDLMGSSYVFWLTRIGVRQIFICPDVNYSCGVHADRWIPVLPNTDAALQLAIIYVWLEEGLWDKEYIDTHAVGMDWIEYYVSGREDGIPKTPKWAEAICGVPSRTIKSFARHWARGNLSIAHCNGGSMIRSCFSTEPARLEGVLMGMQALGHPGRNVIKFLEWGYFSSARHEMITKEFNPTVAAAYHGFTTGKTDYYDIRQSFIPKTLVQQALKADFSKDEPLSWYGVGMAGWPISQNFLHFTFPNAIAKTDIHMVWSDTPCWTTCWNGGNEFIEGIRNPKIEFFLVQHPWMENDCLLADLILPICTKLELNDIGCDCENGQEKLFLYEEQCVSRYGESMSDYEAVAEIARKFGCYDEFVGNKTEEEWIEYGYEQSGVADFISLDDLKEKKYIGFGCTDDWKEAPRGMAPFYEDPETNPLTTPSGKLEFYSTAIASIWPDDNERPPYPKWIDESDRLQERLSSDRAKDYPFLLESNHPRWRVHANMDDVPWLREIPTCKVTGPDGYQYEPAWIHPSDAEKLGVKDGDVVKIYNERGWVLGGAIVTERIIPRTVYQDHGARRDPIGEDGDRAGANNIIAPSAVCTLNAPGEVTSGFLVGVEKVDPFELAREYPEEFSRTITPGRGVCVENWLAE